MPTTKRRINIALPFEVERILGRVSKRDEVPRATKVADLIRVALEIEEDSVLDTLASERDVKGAKFILHDKTWD
jgi:hypothetical protein